LIAITPVGAGSAREEARKHTPYTKDIHP
jgi:hypothetical protein